MEKVKIVWISPYAPYDTVMHAGGKNHNFFVKYMNKKDNLDIKLLTICDEDEKDKVDLDKYEIKKDIVIRKKGFIKIYNIESELNPFHKLGGLVSNQREYLLKRLVKLNESEIRSADAVILQWTESLIVMPVIEKYKREKCKIIAIEEDVTFLRYLRKSQAQRGISHLIWEKRYQIEKRGELDYLSQCDVVCCLNDKDRKLLVDNEVDDKKIITITPYFDNYCNVQSKNSGYDIIFYGFMQRKENETAAIWFIDNVLPLLDDKYRFIIVGGKPSERIKKRACSRVVVTGYVKDISPYLEESLCMVVPLLLGAGIKIKVLEALSAGKVVLTNSIGAEGIPMVHRENYFHCNEASEYATTIREIHENKELAEYVSCNAKRFIMERARTEIGLDKLGEYLSKSIKVNYEKNSASGLK